VKVLAPFIVVLFPYPLQVFLELLFGFHVCEVTGQFFHYATTISPSQVIFSQPDELEQLSLGQLLPMSFYILVFLLFKIFWDVFLFTAFNFVAICPMHHKYRRIFLLVRGAPLSTTAHLQIRVLCFVLLLFFMRLLLPFKFVRFLFEDILAISFVHDGLDLELLFRFYDVLLLRYVRSSYRWIVLVSAGGWLLQGNLFRGRGEVL